MPDKRKDHTAATVRQRITQATRSLLRFLLPPACVVCRRPGGELCPSCRQALPFLQEPLCGRCGRPTRMPTPRCMDCYRHPPALEAIRAALLFSAPVPAIIHRFKYGGQHGLAPLLAELMDEAWPAWVTPPDLVLAIPMHAARLRKRGYNQAALLAGALAARRRWTYDPTGITRTIATRPQVGLPATARRRNLENAFAVADALVFDRRILLVDDVCTTGATLETAARALHAAGARSVFGYCLARAP